jgi:thymidylate synthase ThyX
MWRPLMPKATEVFCINTSQPEVLAYAMAKYSRSSLSMSEAIQDISSQKASDFLQTFYYAYGHKSIADMAHVPMALENISMLAAIEVVDEPRWDGQERSTRYQDFSNPEFITPSSLPEFGEVVYSHFIQVLFQGYSKLSASAFEMLARQNPRPEAMTEEAYTRTLKARAFDIARYLLPLGTTTSVGQVTSARTLAAQLSRMRGLPYSELHELADRMEFAASTESLGENEVGAYRMTSSPMAPTLVKHTEASDYDHKRRKWAEGIAKRVMQGELPEVSGTVSLIRFRSLAIELVATAIYEVTQFPMSQILRMIARYNIGLILDMAAEAASDRGKFDEMARTWRSGYQFCFDIHMDIGGFRDFHRHRRCVQIFQDYSAAHYAVPDPIVGTEYETEYRSLMENVQHTYTFLQQISSNSAENQGSKHENYLLPLGMKRRFLMKMDLAELVYITELRTAPAGHFSYRKVAYEMYEAAVAAHPWLKDTIRVSEVGSPGDIFKR